MIFVKIMKRKYRIEGESWGINGVRKPFNFDLEFELSDEEEKMNEGLAAMFSKPWRLVTEGRKFGLKGFGRFLVLSSLFIFINFIFILTLAFEVLYNEASKENKGLILAVLLVGVLFTTVAISKAYRFMFVDLMRVVYMNNRGVFEGISNLVVSRAYELIRKNNQVSDDELEKGLELGELSKSKFMDMPSWMRNFTKYILRRMPFHNAVSTLASEIKSNDQHTVARHLFERTDLAVRESVFDVNNTRWAFWLFTLNLVAQVFLLSRI